MSQNTDLGRAVLELAADTSDLIKGIKETQTLVAGLAAAVKASEKQFEGWAESADKSRLSFGKLWEGVAVGELAAKAAEKGMEILWEGVKKTGELLVEMVDRGTKVADVSEAFDGLARSVGLVPTDALKALRDGTQGLVTDYDLMTRANVAFRAGLKLNQDELYNVAKASRVLADSIGGDTREAFDTLLGSLTTGRTKALTSTYGVMADLKTASRELKEGLKEEGDEATTAADAQAKRGAILQAVSKIAKNAGELELDIAEQVERSKVAWQNLWDAVAQGIVVSPALKTIVGELADGMTQAFGGDREQTIRAVALAVDKLALKVLELSGELLNAADYIQTWATAFEMQTLSIIRSFDKIVGAALEVADVGATFEKWSNPIAYMMGGGPQNQAELRKQIAELKKSIAGLTADMASAQSRSNEWGNALQTLRGWIPGLKAEIEAAEQALAKSTKTLDKNTGALDDNAAAAKRGTGSQVDLDATLQNVARSSGDVRDAVDLYSQTVMYFGRLTRGTVGEMKLADLTVANWTTRVIEADRETKDWSIGLSDLADDFRNLASISGESGLGRVAQGIANVVGGLELGQKASKRLTDSIVNATSTSQLVSGLTGSVVELAGAMDQATSSGNRLANAIGGALTGASYGSAFGVGGTVIGAMFGGLIGALRESEADMQRDLRAWWSDVAGKALTQSQAEALQTEMDNLLQQYPEMAVGVASQLSAALHPLTATASTLQEIQDRVASVFASYRSGLVDLGTLTNVIDANWAQLVSFMDETSGFASDALLSLIQQARDAKAVTSEMTAYLQKQTSSAAEGWNAVIGSLTWKDTQGGLAQFTNASTITEAIAASMVKSGTSIIDVATKLKDSLAALKAGEEATAGTAGSLYGPGGSKNPNVAIASSLLAQELEDISVWAEKNTAAAEAAKGFDAVVKGLYNSGAMTMDVFGALGQQATVLFQTMETQGLTGDEAMKVMQGDLQALWELQQKYGWALDETTQQLLDTAAAYGLVGKEQMSDTEKMVMGIDRVASAVEKLVKLFGGDLTNAIGDATDAINKIPDEVGVTLNVDRRDSYSGGEYPGGTYHMGGIVHREGFGAALARDFAHAHSGLLVGGLGVDEVPIIAKAGEGILSRDRGMPALGALALSALNRGQTPGGGAKKPTTNIFRFEIRAIDSADVKGWMVKSGVPALSEIVRRGGTPRRELLEGLGLV